MKDTTLPSKPMPAEWDTLGHTSHPLVLMIGAIKSRKQLEKVRKLFDEVPDLALTLFVSPALTAFRPVHPRARVGMYGWEGTRNECLAWTDEQAEVHLVDGLQKGFAPLFMPPNFSYDEDLEAACEKLKVKIVTNKPDPDGRIHVYCPIYTLEYHPAFSVENLRAHTGGFDLL